jgi:F-type H+-transporting ATPase subunit delta
MDVALKEHADLSAIESDLAAFVGVVQAHAELQKVLFSPAVPVPNKRGAVAELAGRVGVQPMVGKLLLLLADRDRLVLLPDLLDVFRQRLLDHQNVVRAEVTTTETLDPDQQQRIQQSLARATGRSVQLTTRVDPSIIGGLIARIGGTVFDASITNQLQRMKQRLDESI